MDVDDFEYEWKLINERLIEPVTRKPVNQPEVFHKEEVTVAKRILRRVGTDLILCFHSVPPILDHPEFLVGSPRIEANHRLMWPDLMGLICSNKGISMSKESRAKLARLSFTEKVKLLEKLRDRSLALAASRKQLAQKKKS